ncbi:Dipeptidyl aminopeptidase/acylaminoacyl peptidase [Sphingomonas palmae]|uniref:Dipeptidyl aminopeptidase/acylaminoacyl peptidase n=1 Tax=Sphingomonas palmae TaxID=1855283 RepID=A0A1H7LXE0_9SPHN|nr:S9 family peptidase [Sphingomonas palmae]SEL03650.1 Dipeptidyl aminopeptidase/acylaminoacyl peptidase [Sphingomonas palmae]
MRLIPLAALLLATAAPAFAQTIHQYGALAIAPTGDRVAAVENGAARGVITFRSAADGRILRTIDPCATCTYSGLTFAPNGDLVFLARDAKAGNVRLMDADAKATRTIATVAGIAQTPRVSPDGKRVALLVTLGAAKEAGATQAGVRMVGEIGEKNDEQRLAVFDLSREANAVTPLSPAGRYIYEYDWTPDGRGFVATTALGNGDNNWWVASLDAIDATTGAVRSIAKPAMQLNQPRVSPDGRTVAFIGGLMSDFGSIGGDVFTVPLAGGTPRNITEGAKSTVTTIDWTTGGLRAVTLAGDQLQFGTLTPGQMVKPVFSKPASSAAGDGRAVFSADGRVAAAVVQDYEHAPAIYAGPLASVRQITHDNDTLTAPGTARSVSWKNEGFDVQGWLLAPKTAIAATGKTPMITMVHGGPSAANMPGYLAPTTMNAALLNAGYYVFLPNPRGSYGQGEAFTAANKRDFGGGDLRDILAGIDAVERVAPVDNNRLGLGGCSYGGFMAMWANTQTNRFKAIVAGAGLSNWVSYYGTNGIDQWMLPFFGKSMYDDMKAYEDVSAIYQAKKAKTPTFIYVGERDIEVPPTQSIEWWHALKNQNVPVSLVIYPDAGHCVSGAEQSKDVRARSIAWFDRYVKAAR